MNVPVVYMIATFQPHALTLLDRLAAHVTIRTKGMEDPAVISHQVGRRIDSSLCKCCTSILLLFLYLFFHADHWFLVNMEITEMIT